MRRSIALFALCTLALPALAAAHDDDEQGPPGWWGDAPAPQEEAQVDVNVGVSTPGASIGISTFREPLAAYGQWVDVPGYGTAWRPGGVAAGWRPYYYGRWEWTSEGWLWVTDEPWGWATYHYGRWAYDPGAGWVWVPGYQWAPAWVSWRYGPDFVGWAPLAPGFSVYVSSYPVALSWWTFMPCNSFVGVPVYRYASPYQYVNQAWSQTRPAPPRAALFGHAAPAWGGPARSFIETRIGRPVTPVRVQPVGSPIAAGAAPRGGMVPIFRPEGHPAPRAFAPGAPAAPGRGRPEGMMPRGPAAEPPRAAPQGRPFQPAPGAAPRGNPPGQPRAWGPAPAPRYEPRRGDMGGMGGMGGGAPGWGRREAAPRFEGGRPAAPPAAQAPPPAQRSQPAPAPQGRGGGQQGQSHGHGREQGR